jgi:hypothetical protein
MSRQELPGQVGDQVGTVEMHVVADVVDRQERVDVTVAAIVGAQILLGVTFRP